MFDPRETMSTLAYCHEIMAEGAASGDIAESSRLAVHAFRELNELVLRQHDEILRLLGPVGLARFGDKQ